MSIKYYTENGAIPEAEWSEEVNQAKALLEKHGFQVLLVGGIDMIGALNYHIKYVTELQREVKKLKELKENAEKEVEKTVANYEERIKYLVDHDNSANDIYSLLTGCQYIDVIARQTGVDKRDAPNIYPYKECCNCGERESCGQYQNDYWLCENCYESESESESEEEEEEEEEEKTRFCSVCGIFLDEWEESTCDAAECNKKPKAENKDE